MKTAQSSVVPLVRGLAVMYTLALAVVLQGCGGETAATVEAADRGRAQQQGAPFVLGTPPPRDRLQREVSTENTAPGRPAAELLGTSSLPAPAAVAAAPLVPAASAQTVVERPSARTSSELERAVERAIANAIGTANKRSKGRVHGNNTVVAIHVLDLDTGAEVLSRQAGASLLPASNLKLITLAAAFAELGADHQIETTFEAAGAIRASVLEGDLVARAAGDPLYHESSDGSLRPWAQSLADQLRAAGIDRVAGDLVLDEGHFATPGPGPEWPSSKDYWKEYCALAGGFTVNGGCFTAVVQATQPGRLAQVHVEPAGSGFSRSGKVTTVAKRKALSVAVGATPGKLTVRGTVPADVPSYTARFAIPDPVVVFGAALVSALEAEGIAIEGEVRRERGVSGGPVVGSLRSALADSAIPILRDSNNAVADQVYLHLAYATGQTGDRTGGQAAVSAALERLGVSTKGLVQVDGSGLSKANRTSPRQLTALVAAAMARPGDGATLLRASLPIAGKSGSLARRMRGGPAQDRVRAKTGFVNGASGLSGLVETANGRQLAFSILVNYPHFDGLNTHAFKPMQDTICEALVSLSPDQTKR